MRRALRIKFARPPTSMRSRRPVGLRPAERRNGHDCRHRGWRAWLIEAHEIAAASSIPQPSRINLRRTAWGSGPSRVLPAALLHTRFKDKPTWLKDSRRQATAFVVCLSRPKIARPAGRPEPFWNHASNRRPSAPGIQRIGRGYAVTAYLVLLSDRRFLAFWGGFTISTTGDSMTRVALVWYVLDKTGSSEALGLLAFCSTAPVIVGGLVAGWALDRFDRRTLLIVDSVFRGLVVASVPLAETLGQLTMPHIYAVALVHGFLMMIPLAGVPSILPSIVPAERLGTANALEILSYTMSGIIGAPLAGVLVAHIGAPGVLWADAGSYLAFAFLLTAVRLGPRVAPTPGPVTPIGGYGATLKLVLAQPILLVTTLMYMVFNLGGGALLVWLPLWAASMPEGGAELYGRLLGIMALGQLMSAIAAGFLPAMAPQGRLICLA